MLFYLEKTGQQEGQQGCSAVFLEVQGRVQGVGFRPYVYQLAKQYQLNGWIKNTVRGVEIHLEGDAIKIQQGLEHLKKSLPVHAVVESLRILDTELQSYPSFSIILDQDDGNNPTITHVPYDLALCADCQLELFDPYNRRFAYPFISCTNCGPRFTIMQKTPFERHHTSLSSFDLCARCQEEYHDPENRRFHAQTISCSDCGPRLTLRGKKDILPLLEAQAIIEFIAKKLKNSAIVAMKGLGGFHLLADASDDQTIQLLRRKKRPTRKPFALMLKDLFMVERYCQAGALEKDCLRSPQSPIVILKKSSNPNNEKDISPFVAPNLDSFGVMLPYTAIYHLLMQSMDRPLVVTSANPPGEPICYQETDPLQLKALTELADYVVWHDLPILHPVDDSIVQFAFEKPMLLRLGRSYAPASLPLKGNGSANIWAVGAHSKSAFSLSFSERIILGQYIGDLTSLDAMDRFRKEAKSYQSLYSCDAEIVAADLHPAYGSTLIAEASKLPLTQVPHHVAHILACVAEHQLFAHNLLGISWDGSGLGTDGSVWGGEFFLLNQNHWCRMAYFNPFPLIGGEGGIRQPKRMALSLLKSCYRDYRSICQQLGIFQYFSAMEWRQLSNMLEQGWNCPNCSSAGRLFDGIASLLGLCHEASYEAEASILLENLAAQNLKSEESDVYDVDIDSDPMPMRIIWEELVRSIVEDRLRECDRSEIAAKFHRSMAMICIRIACQIRQKIPTLKTVVLAGGVFQNRLLLESAAHNLQEQGFQVFWPQALPNNDASLAVGQILYADRKMMGLDTLCEDHRVFSDTGRNYKH